MRQVLPYLLPLASLAVIALLIWGASICREKGDPITLCLHLLPSLADSLEVGVRWAVWSASWQGRTISVYLIDPGFSPLLTEIATRLARAYPGAVIHRTAVRISVPSPDGPGR